MERLAGHGFEAVHWSSVGAAIAPDVEILTWANEHQFVVITTWTSPQSTPPAPAMDRASLLHTQDLLSESAARIVVRALEAHPEDIERGALPSMDGAGTRRPSAASSPVTMSSLRETQSATLHTGSSFLPWLPRA